MRDEEKSLIIIQKMKQCTGIRFIYQSIIEIEETYLSNNNIK